MNIQWYPGHMTKALRQMQNDIKLVDLVIELLDARVPVSSRNPDIDTLCGNRSRLVILNKSDLADKAVLDGWIKHFEGMGITCVSLDSRDNSSVKNVRNKCLEACHDKIERDRARGIKNRPIRAMIAGIPNVGKSTFINSFSGKASAKTGNKPGVTKGAQWIKIDRQLELLDTPGILWPKFEDQTVAMNLALIGSINDEILSREDMCSYLMKYLNEHYPDAIRDKYGGDDLDKICERLGCIKKGSEYDHERARGIILDDFRSGKLGKISLEVCEQ